MADHRRRGREDADEVVDDPAPSTPAQPFARSRGSTGMPSAGRTTRQTFVAPIVPAPVVRMSLRRPQRTSQCPDGIGPPGSRRGRRAWFVTGLGPGTSSGYLGPSRSRSSSSRGCRRTRRCRRAIRLVVEEVRVLVDVERDERRRIPDRERVLRVADVVEEPALVPVVRRPRPAAPAMPVAFRSARHASAEPKSRSISAPIAPSGSPPSPPRCSK